MKTNKRILTLSFFFVQFFICFFLNYKGVAYILLAETLFFYLLTEDLTVLMGNLPYFFLIPSEAFVCFIFAFFFHFFRDKVKISLKISLIIFLFLYFFTARYEPYLIKAVMPGFIAFVSVIYAMTRVPASQKILAPAVALYTVAGFIYGILFNVFSFLRYEPYLMFSVDLIQIVMAAILFVSLRIFSEKKPPYSDNDHHKSNA